MGCLCLETATARVVCPPCLPEEAEEHTSEGILWQCHSVLS